MQKLKKNLKKKGWTKRDITNAVKIIDEAKKKKHPVFKVLDKLVYWTALVVAVLGNLIISIALIPSLIALNSVFLFLVVIILGLSFGFLFELLVRSIEHLEPKHHLFLGFFVPILSVKNFFIVTALSNDLMAAFNINNDHNPFAIGILYTISFITPYLIFKLVLKKDYYS